MKHKTLKSILFSFALGLALYATVLPDTTPEPKEPVPTASPAPDATETPADGIGAKTFADKDEWNSW
ncbi:hypothetical protein [uncultured Acetatifactor sp.]|jgi:hypothetical protein|uniref:hypothetical protein n=1 Tax=uncultured Acetatifactor sp. TaxID=1671927 RepID=UPI0026388B86|nr:hypothetical protein [uncultured Acetatifactor sp.]MCI8696207.1 hypothetical protein [Lachnospiraceae bacterium]MCI9651408.1 hypothetical protein [Lachnospiraceae bacterium]